MHGINPLNKEKGIINKLIAKQQKKNIYILT